MEVNGSKCELYLVNPTSDECKNAHNSFNHIQQGVKIVNKQELTLLGAPIFPEAIKNVLSVKLSNLQEMTHRLNEIDQHEAFFLLKNCFSIPRWVYFLRTAPCFTKPEILIKFDQTIKSSLSDLLNISLTDAAFDQASLPVANSG